VSSNGSDATCVEEQLRLLTHRGPDAAGAFRRGPGVVAQTRLAVIDLQTGDPPITDESGRIGAVLNGELYNFRALRAQLERDGHRLATQGDTEVLAHLAETDDAPQIARRLDGMFAFAIWDSRRGRLLLGRDRLGKKPLYYATTGRAFVFGSEIKAVLAHGAVSRELDDEALPAYLTSSPGCSASHPAMCSPCNREAHRGSSDTGRPITTSGSCHGSVTARFRMPRARCAWGWRRRFASA
jgi:asparagine synthase (glutamine-hydrolysing)